MTSSSHSGLCELRRHFFAPSTQSALDVVLAERKSRSRTDSQTRPVAPAIVQLAEQIRKDIQNRGLRPGDPYLNAADTARMLRIGTATANRALQLLEQRQILVRRQRRGTFVAQPLVSPEISAQRVNLIVDQNYLKTEGILADGVMVGIQSVLPQADLRFRFMPVSDDADFVHRMIDEALQSPDREGFVLVRSSLTVQKLVADSGLPAVIHGTPYPSINSIPWIDRDIVQTGLLLTDLLLKQGCRHFLLLLRQQVLPGDHQLLETVQHRLQKAGLAQAISIRCLPADLAVIQQDVRDVLRSVTDKVGILCRSIPMAEGASAAVKPQNDGPHLPPAEIVVTDLYRTSPGQNPAWPYTQMSLAPQEIGARIGTLLADQFAQRPVTEDHAVIPVKLILPTSTTQMTAE